jgi:AraC-like DNA-binding protein
MELSNGEVFPLYPGVCLWMRPGRLYLASQEEREPLGVTFRHFELGECSHCPAQEYFEVRDPVFFEQGFRKISLRLGPRGVGEEGPVDSQTEALFRALLQECIDSVEPNRPASGEETLIHRDMVRIWENPGSAPTVRELARQGGYSPDHYARIFRKVARQSPREWRVMARMDRARRLLLESSRTIQEIADLLGYADIYFFSRQFKDKNGVSPRLWRERRRVPPD